MTAPDRYLAYKCCTHCGKMPAYVDTGLCVICGMDNDMQSDIDSQGGAS